MGMGISYMIGKMTSLNYQGLWQSLNRLRQKTGRSRLALLWDMQTCARRHGAGYIDYENCGLYDCSEAERATYLTAGRNASLWKQYNDHAYLHWLDHKPTFARRFSAFFRRDWVELTESSRAEALGFLEKHPVFLLKPADGCCGQGIVWVTRTEPAQTMLNRLMATKPGWLCEAPITQHPALNAVNPAAVNTLRVITLIKNGTPTVVCTYWRIGGNGECVDNFNHGGMVAPVDENTGQVTADAVDKSGRIYLTHPHSGHPIRGFVFPDWTQMCRLVLEAATQIPQLGYIGWDVAFTPDGPLLVEANPFPGHDIYQLIPHTPHRIGILAKFQ